MYGTKPLTKKNVLEKISPYDIFSYYINGFTTLGKKFRSELRDDKLPTCSIVRVGAYHFVYKDFGLGQTLDCFSYVQLKFGLNFLETLAKINADFNLNLSTSISFQPSAKIPIIHDKLDLPIKVKSNIKVVYRNWNKLDKLFWYDTIQASTKYLEIFGIKPISGFFVNEIYYKTEPVAYCYTNYTEDGEEVYKIYQPFLAVGKWFSNYDNFTFFGGELQLKKEFEPDIPLIITKSLKDTVAISLLGFKVVNPPAEGSDLDKFFIRNPEYLNNSFILYDNDKAGILYAEKQYQKYNIPYYYFNKNLEVKDSYEYIKKYGKSQLKELLLEKALNYELDCSNSRILG